MDSSALKPTIFNINAFKKDEEAAKKGATEEERFLYNLITMKGWLILMEFKERVFKEMEDANKALMASGQSFDEIGKNAVVINLAESIVDRIINKVNDAAEVCETATNE